MEETRLRRKNRESKRVKSYDGGASKGRLEIQDKSRFKKRFSNKVPSKFPKSRNDRVSNLKSQKGKSTSLPTKNRICGKCGKKHYGDCLVGTDNCFRCVMICHKVRDFPNLKGQDKCSGQAQASGSNVDAPKKNHFYALRSYR